VLFAAAPTGGDIREFAADETLAARFFALAGLPADLLWWHRRMIADALAGTGGVAWSLNVVWPFDGDRRQVAAQVRRDPAFAEHLRASFSTVPAAGAADNERLEVGP
jgi:hypothetical protein